jgi:rhodanese-related sulfurtransferase
MRRSARELVARARARVESLTVDAVATELEAGTVLLLDVREAAELTEHGRIPGSVWVPRGVLEFRADPTSRDHQQGFDADRRVIVHCSGGDRSALAAATLQEMGFNHVAYLDGGITAWKRAGRPTV